MDQEQRTHDLKVQWTTVQGHHKESMDQLSENSRQLAALKTELHKSQQQNQALTEEVKKTRKLSFKPQFIYRKLKFIYISSEIYV